MRLLFFKISFRIVLGILYLLALPVSGIHYLAVRLHLLGVCPCIAAKPKRLARTLYDLWFTRIARDRIEKIAAILAKMSHIRESGLDEIVTLQSPLPQGGCVFATLHSPWNYAVALWANSRKNFSLISGVNDWKNRIPVIPRIQPALFSP